MPGPITSSGDIIVSCHTTESDATRGSAMFDAITPGDTVYLVFNPDEGTSPPYELKISSPSGGVILSRTIRSLPIVAPQSPPPISFVVSVKGTYQIEIKASNGRHAGRAALLVT